MTERERLIELLRNQNCHSPMLCDKNCKYAHLESCYEDRTADWLLANGVIVPPCKVGDITYIFDYEVNNHLESKLRGIAPSIVEAVVIEDEGVWVENEHAKYHITSFGDIIFLTREDAEKALKERSKGK